MEDKSRKILFGCLFGCAALAGVGLVAMISFFVWLNTAGEPLDPDKLIGDNTRGYASWTISLNDPATAHFFETLMDEIDRAQEQPDLPGPMQALVRFNQQRNREQMARMFPMIAAWTAVSASADESEDLHLWTVSLAAAANQIRLVDLGLRMAISDESEGMRQRDYRDEQFFEVTDEDQPFVWFIRGGDIYVASGLEPAERIVDLLLDGRQGESADSQRRAKPSPIVEVDPQVAARFTKVANPAIRGAVGNEFGLLTRLVESREFDESWVETAQRVRGLQVFGGFSNDQDFTLSFYVDCGVAECEGTELQRVAHEFLVTLIAEGIDAELRFDGHGDGAFVSYDLRRITDWFSEWIRSTEQRVQELSSGG